MADQAHFDARLFEFLDDLAENNDRDWFQAHRRRYIEHVRDPMLRFVAAFAPRLEGLSPHFVADPRPMGGSMFRIHRDVRFSRDKSPYKTMAAAQFRHEVGKDVHAPGFYVHLGRDEVFAGAGLWHPDAAALLAIREAIVADPDGWVALTTAEGFRAALTLGGDTLKRPPRGFDAGHPLIEDLKRKDFVCSATLSREDALRADFIDRFAALCEAAAPLVAFLTRAVGLPF